MALEARTDFGQSTSHLISQKRIVTLHASFDPYSGIGQPAFTPEQRYEF